MKQTAVGARSDSAATEVRLASSRVFTLSPQSPSDERRRLLALAVIGVLLTSVCPWVARSSYQGSTDLHAAMEACGSLLGLVAGFTLIARTYVHGNRFHLLIGLAYFVNGAEDLVHGALSFRYFQEALRLPANSPSIPVTYVTGRLLMGLILLVAPWVAARFGSSRRPKQETIWASLAVLVATVGLTVLAFELPLPRFVRPEWIISRPVDFLSAVVLFAALAGFLWEYHRRRDMLTWWIALSITVGMVGQFAMSFSKTFYDPLFDLAHLYKVVGYLIPLLGFSLYQIAILTERQKVEAALRLDESRLEALLRLNQMTEASLKELTDFTLEEAVRLTSSEIGYLAFMNEDETVLTMHSWSKTAMEQCAIIDKPIVYPVVNTGLWGEAVRQRRPVITNDYAAPNPLKKGYPEGHVAVRRHMNIPVFDGKRIVAVSGVGNKREEYDESDVRQLTLLMEGMWRLIQRRRTEEELRKHRDHLEELVAERAAELKKTNEQLVGEVAGRRRALEEMRLAEQKYRTLLRFTDEGIYGVDRERRCTFINRAAADALGYSADEVIGRNMHELIHHTRADGRPYPAQECPMCRVLEKGEGCRVDTEVFWRRDGTSFPVEYSANAITDASGAVTGAVVAFTDITKRREAERQLKEATLALERSNKELEQFAYVASHDLQEPLRMISSYVQLLAQRYRGKLDADADDYIHFAVDGAHRMQTLINDLLAYSRVGTRGKSFEPTDCGAVLDRALNNLQVAIEESGATVTHGPLPTVSGDATQLTQLFQNLIGNAVKFRRKEEAPRVHVAAEPRDGEWLFSVRDNGIGLDMRFAERIFMIFQRLHTRDEYPGTGIGLALCKKIVERHGGRIWVESEPGKGSTFYFTLPAAGPAGPPAALISGTT
ncbi:MAG: GAF domain-containing protein [Verrucomicrobiae bacterium]|nr:GAF domain-containing protein [Verrucomicrobiae bacterium]